MGGARLAEWCINKPGTGVGKKDTRVIILLVMWELWKHCNVIVFDGATPSHKHVLHRIEVEVRT